MNSSLVQFWKKNKRIDFDGRKNNHKLMLEAFCSSFSQSVIEDCTSGEVGILYSSCS